MQAGTRSQIFRSRMKLRETLSLAWSLSAKHPNTQSIKMSSQPNLNSAKKNTRAALSLQEESDFHRKSLRRVRFR